MAQKAIWRPRQRLLGGLRTLASAYVSVVSSTLYSWLQVMRFHSAPPLPYGSETDVPPPPRGWGLAERSPRPRGGIPLGMSIPELPGRGRKLAVARHSSVLQEMLAPGAVETTRLRLTRLSLRLIAESLLGGQRDRR